MNKLFLLSLATVVAALSLSTAEAGLRGKHHRGQQACCDTAPVCCEPAPVACCEPAPVVCCEPAPVVCCEPAPVVCCEPAPVVCCEADPCGGRAKRAGLFSKHRQAKAAKRAARANVACCDPCSVGY